MDTYAIGTSLGVGASECLRLNRLFMQYIVRCMMEYMSIICGSVSCFGSHNWAFSFGGDGCIFMCTPVAT